MKELDTRKIYDDTSLTITAARFPLVILVLFVHATIWTHTTTNPELFSERTFKFVTDLFSFNLGSIAVPAYFILSGFLFFWSINTAEKNFIWFKNKITKRLSSLFIPYIIWNTLLVIAILLKNFTFHKLGLPEDESIAALKNGTLIGIIWSGPINLPLWYIRNLICCVLISPIIYMLIQRFKWISISIILLLYISPTNFGIPGFNVVSITLFCLGAWMGIYKFDFIQHIKRIKLPIYILSIILLFTATIFTGKHYHYYILRIFWIVGIPAFFNLITSLTRKQSINKFLGNTSKYAFFIYVSHEIYILGWTKGGLLRLLGSSLPAEYIQFFTIPIVVTLICISLYEILDKICPGILRVSLGGRK